MSFLFLTPLIVQSLPSSSLARVYSLLLCSLLRTINFFLRMMRWVSSLNPSSSGGRREFALRPGNKVFENDCTNQERSRPHLSARFSSVISPANESALLCAFRRFSSLSVGFGTSKAIEPFPDVSAIQWVVRMGDITVRLVTMG